MESQLLSIAANQGLVLDPEVLETFPILWKYQRERSKTLVEWLEESQFVWKRPDCLQGLVLDAQQNVVLGQFNLVLKTVLPDQWQPETLKLKIAEFLKANDLKMPALGLPLRQVLIGRTSSPPLEITLYLIGREETLKRLESILV